MRDVRGVIMAKTRKHAGAAKGTRMPGWIRDKENQRKWNGRFIELLKKYYLNSDPAISAMLANERLSQVCATKIRSYVDKGVTNWWYGQNKAKGAKYKKTLKTAISGSNDFETLRQVLTEFSEFFHVSGTGLLIQTSLGRASGLGALRTKRSG